MAGQKKLHAATVASQEKTITNPNEEEGGAIPFHSLATTAVQGKGNNISSPLTPGQTPETPRPRQKTIPPGEPTLPRSADLRGNQASSSPAPPQVALTRRGSSSGALILTRRRSHHLDDAPENLLGSKPNHYPAQQEKVPATTTPLGFCPVAPPAVAGGGVWCCGG
jgi:hypothetical protein